MDKNKITVFIFSLVLIAFIAAVSIRENTIKNQIQYVTVTQSTESAAATTTPADSTKVISKTMTSQKVTVRTTTVSEATVTDHITTTPEPLHININTADAEELMKLPGIGEGLAGRIVEYRESAGYFRNIEEIMLVNGIGDGIFSKICENIYVDDPVYDTEIISEPNEYDDPPEELPEESTEEVTEVPRSLLEDVIPIDLNTADVETLMLLPYITEEYAMKIIDLREKIGGFSHPYEIYYIEVLEQQQVNEIMKYVTVSP